MRTRVRKSRRRHGCGLKNKNLDGDTNVLPGSCGGETCKVRVGVIDDGQRARQRVIGDFQRQTAGKTPRSAFRCGCPVSQILQPTQKNPHSSTKVPFHFKTRPRKKRSYDALQAILSMYALHAAFRVCHPAVIYHSAFRTS